MKKGLLTTVILALLFPSALAAAHPNTTTNIQKALVTAEKAEVFLEASQNSIVIDTIPKGTTITLFPSGKKNKKWLYISYLSEARGSQVTGFVDSHRVKIIKENSSDEPEALENKPEPVQEEVSSALEDKETRTVEKELEGSDDLLKGMEEQQEAVNTKSEEVVQHAPGAIEQEVKKEEREAQKDKNAETTPEKEQEAVLPKEELPEQTKAATNEKNDRMRTEEVATEPIQSAETEELPKVLTKVSVKVPRANVRLMPTTQSAVIHQVPSGTELKHVAKTGNWYRVILSPNEDGLVLSGYIHRNIVDEIYETVAPPPEPERPPVSAPDVVEEKTENEPEPKPVQEVPTLQKKSLGEYYWAGGGAGYTVPSHSRFGEGINFGANIGFGLTRYLAVELRVPYFKSEVIGSPDGLSSGHLNSLSLMLSIQGRYPLRDRYVPYLVAGADYHLNKFRLNEQIVSAWEDLGFTIQENVDNAFGFHVGAGLDVFLKDNIAFNFDARYYTANLKGQRVLANQAGQEATSGTLDSMELNSLQVGVSIKIFLKTPGRKK